MANPTPRVSGMKSDRNGSSMMNAGINTDRMQSSASSRGTAVALLACKTAEARCGVEEATRAREERAEDDAGEGGSRREMLERHGALKREVEAMGRELAKYADCDPVELEVQNERASAMRSRSEAYSDQIHSLADWIRDKAGVDRETLTSMKKKWYGDQFDEEDQDLRELQ